MERDGDGYLIYAPGLQGCTTWGDTPEEAQRNMEEVLPMYLQSLQESGDPIPYGPDVCLSRPADATIINRKKNELPLKSMQERPEAWEEIPLPIGA